MMEVNEGFAMGPRNMVVVERDTGKKQDVAAGR
jgi:hypothetical protein